MTTLAPGDPWPANSCVKSVKWEIYQYCSIALYFAACGYTYFQHVIQLQLLVQLQVLCVFSTIVPVIPFGSIVWPVSWWWLCSRLWCQLTRILLQILSPVLGKGTPMFQVEVMMNNINVEQYQLVT